MSVEDRVAAGAKWMDGKAPGWAARIDLGELNFPSLECCVLGQLYGDYHKGIEQLDAGGVDLYELGFVADHSDEYELITEEWWGQVLARVKTDG